MKGLFLFFSLLFAGMPAFAQLPPAQKINAEIRDIYNTRNSIFETWKGPVSRKMESEEWESKYNFPGSTDAIIRQRQADNGKVVYYYQAVLAEGKTAAEVQQLFKDWEQLLLSCRVGQLSLQRLDHTAPDEQGVSAFVYGMLPANGKDAPVYEQTFRVHLNYEAGDDGLYVATIQIGYP